MNEEKIIMIIENIKNIIIINTLGKIMLRHFIWFDSNLMKTNRKRARIKLYKN